ncbi:ornithine cyclodeaminase [Priestia aryabhattai]|uniref:ornithine cyclodeaminase family protein n=1 Tax=Bacillaceae TaxID=186817 RepID=UPI000BA12640|nr:MULTISPECIES: ornithine cyclodeaminase [Bacillaceae]MDT2046253.1 ornithine cyclodeaminase family protein [Priestia flexa]OZT10728.1 ornithine cyclodeaminase [Priestia aryabhattai]TDB50059.1 ornithine cyclodeaminase family protein [Bacillus sp. CBEL-1]USY53724.1 ornithine cyclodeaminase family protein [Bacillus sp. 1780r2a1]
MLLLNEKMIRELYTMKDCIRDVEQGFRYGTEGKAKAPVRLSLAHEKKQAETLYMPSYVEPVDYTAVKVVSIFPENANEGKKVLQGMILLTNALTGEHVALLDASYLTVLRTGASSGVATKYLARNNAKVCAVLGCGTQSIGQVQAMMEVRSLEQILLYNRTVKKAYALKDEIKALYPTWSGDITVVNDADQAVQGADIVICSSKSSTPLFNGSLLRPGTHVNAIGSYQPHMQEVDVETLLKSDKVVVDTYEGAMHEAGDLLVPIDQGLWEATAIYGELGEIVCERKGGRTAEEEITFYESVGIAYLDTMVAKSVYEKAVELGIGTTFEF